MVIKERKHSENDKISNRVLIFFITLSILGVLFSFMAFRLSVRDVVVDNFKKSEKMNAKHKLEDVEDLINEIVDHLDETSKLINEYNDFNDPGVKEVLEVSSKFRINWFDYIAVSDAEGNGYDNSGNKFQIAERDYFKTAMQGTVAFSDVMDSKVFKGEKVQIIAHPIRTSENEVRGVVFCVFNIEHIRNMPLDECSNDDSELYIIDQNGSYVGNFQCAKRNYFGNSFWDYFEKSSLSDQEIAEIKSDFEKSEAGEFNYIDNGEQRYVCYMPIGPNKWQLVYSVANTSVNEITNLLYNLDTKNYLFTISCFAVLTICIVWYFKKSNNKIKESHQEAEKNMEFMRMAFEYSKHIVLEYNQEKRTIYLKTNGRNHLFNQDVIESVPDSFITMNIIVPDSIATFKKLFEVIETESSCKADIQITYDYEEIWYRILMKNVYNSHGEIIDTLGVVEDISDLKKKEKIMLKKLQVQNTLISNAILYGKINLATAILIEYNGEDVQLNYSDFLHKFINENVSVKYMDYVKQTLSLASLKDLYDQGKEVIETEFVMKYDNSFKWVSCIVYRIHNDDNSKVIFIVTDIHEKKCKELALKEQAERDGLTKLYNNATLRFKINEILSLNHTTDANHIFIILDLDNFKLINDTFGHDYGDKVLKDVATTLNNRFRSSDIVGRLGGDEFVVFLCNVKSFDSIKYLIEELVESLHKTYRKGNKEVTISASIGVAMAPKDGDTFEELYKKSDVAQYRVKKGRKNDYKLF